MELTKIAQNEEMTYLEKVAAIVDEFAAGNVDGAQADAVATEAGISPEDLLSVYNAAYGEAGEMEKTASDEAMTELNKIAADEASTYLTKCAGIADAFMADAFEGNEGLEAMADLELDGADVNAILDLAYGDLDKEAGAKTDAVKDFITKNYEGAKKGAKEAGEYVGKKARQGYESTKKVAGETYDKAGGHKTAAGVAAGATAGFGAAKLLGKDK